MKSVQVGTLLTLWTAIMASAAPVQAPSNEASSAVVLPAKRALNDLFIKQLGELSKSDLALAKQTLDSNSGQLETKKKSMNFTTEQAMNYASVILGLGVLPLYAYGRWTNSKAIANFDRQKEANKILAAKAEATAAAAEKFRGKKHAGGIDISSGGGSMFGRSVDDSVALYVRDDTIAGGGGSNANHEEDHLRGGAAEDDRLNLLTKLDQHKKESRELKLKKAELQKELMKQYGFDPLGKTEKSAFNMDLGKGLGQVGQGAADATPTHPKLDKNLAAVGLGAALLGIWMGYDSAWKGKHYLDGSREALAEVKKKMPPGWSKRDVNNESVPRSLIVRTQGQPQPVLFVPREEH